jgi:hypothetical protein
MKVGDKVKIIGVNYIGANHYIGYDGVVTGTGLVSQDIKVEKIKMKTGYKWSWFPESSLEKIEPEKLPKPSPEKPQFKVGDDVEIIGLSINGYKTSLGKIGIINEIFSDGDSYLENKDGLGLGVYQPSSLKLITKEPKFKKGDRVKNDEDKIGNVIKVTPPMGDEYKHNHYHYDVDGIEFEQDESWLKLVVEENRVDYPDKPTGKTEDTFYCLYVDGTGGFAHKHYTQAEAMKEAERLAKQGRNRGQKVHVLKAIASCEVPETPVQWNFK